MDARVASPRRLPVPRRIALAFAAVVAVSGGPAAAADGDPDSTFNSNGTEVLAYSASNSEDDRSTGLCVQPDGKLLVHGVHSIGNAGHQVKLVRLRADGGLDPGFATVTAPMSGANTSPSGPAINAS